MDDQKIDNISAFQRNLTSKGAFEENDIYHSKEMTKIASSSSTSSKVEVVSNPIEVQVPLQIGESSINSSPSRLGVMDSNGVADSFSNGVTDSFSSSWPSVTDIMDSARRVTQEAIGEAVASQALPSGGSSSSTDTGNASQQFTRSSSSKSTPGGGCCPLHVNIVECEEMEIDDAVEWETYKGGKYWHHAAAGASAGVAEHLIMYPFDTIKTNLQAVRGDSCAKPCPKNGGINSANTCSKPVVGRSMATSSTATGTAGVSTTTRTGLKDLGSAAQLSVKGVYQDIMLTEGWTGLYRGVSAMALGCVPAHIGYFTAYEATKWWVANYVQDEATGGGSGTSPNSNGSSSSSPSSSSTNSISSSPLSTYQAWMAGSAAGCAAAFTHDLILTPLDVAKQRMQLGQGKSCSHCVQQVIQTQGYLALYRSFPITLMSNVPFGMILVGVNEGLKTSLGVSTQCTSWDDMKQKLPIYFGLAGFASGVAGFATQPLDVLKTRIQTQQCLIEANRNAVKYKGIIDATAKIFREEGVRAFFKGAVPRAAVVIPSGAISWASYEVVKSFLVNNF